jgi:bifunctional DNA-binding transcriptional regulator/antitoxin component of YhaV-PrlF toxin-antitoxin module
VTILKLHYEGWLALPATFRQKLGLSKDAVLEAELVGGTIVLRPAARLKASPRTEVEELGSTAAQAKPRAKRKQAAPPPLKSRGRRAKPAEGSLAHTS